jgi:PAS domain S-box-containing protein
MTQLAKSKSTRFLITILASLIVLLFTISILFTYSNAEQIDTLLGEGTHTDSLRDILFSLTTTQLILCFIGVCLLVGILRIIYNAIYKPLTIVQESIKQLAEGDLEIKIENASNNEMHELFALIQKLAEGNKKTTEFVREMGKGDFSTNFVPLSDKDELGNTLLEMRQNLLGVAEDEKKRNWVNEGLAKFGETLRMDTNNIQKFSENILTQLVKYIGANQGLFYVLNEEAESGPHLELTACYAWERKKHLEDIVKVGQGLTGQVVLEKEIIYMTDVPNDFVNITSGLGQSNPRSVILLPLKYNDEVFGVIEMASFQLFEPYQQDFLNKLCVSIASSISTVRINVRTQKLLDESLIQSKELQEKDGTMRQNLEEMRATQEEMERKSIEMQHMELKTTAILEGCVDCIIAFNYLGKIEFFNKAAQDIWGISREDALGTNIKDLLPIELKETIHGSNIYYTEGGKQKELLNKTELNVQNANHDEVSILCSISKTMIGDKCFFTAFIQNISVDIF